MGEMILAIKRDFLPDDWLGIQVALPMTKQSFMKQIAHADITFIERTTAENDFNYKQIIPYIILIDSNNRVATYQRKGSEKRLTGLSSLGVGGHLRQDDFTQGEFVFSELFGKALHRELNEELIGLPLNDDLEFIGLINEEKTEVGLAHLGIVFVIRNVDHVRVIAGEELGTLKWISVLDLFNANCESFELWSQLALALLKESV